MKVWSFDIHNKAGEKVAVLDVHKGTGRLMHSMDPATGDFAESAYAWEATLTYSKPTFGQKPVQSLMVTEKALRAYRKAVEQSQEALEATP